MRLLQPNVSPIARIPHTETAIEFRLLTPRIAPDFIPVADGLTVPAPTIPGVAAATSAVMPFTPVFSVVAACPLSVVVISPMTNTVELEVVVIEIAVPSTVMG